jgi:hypothetical protein
VRLDHLLSKEIGAGLFSVVALRDGFSIFLFFHCIETYIVGGPLAQAVEHPADNGEVRGASPLRPRLNN